MAALCSMAMRLSPLADSPWGQGFTLRPLSLQSSKGRIKCSWVGAMMLGPEVWLELDLSPLGFWEPQPREVSLPSVTTILELLTSKT